MTMVINFADGVVAEKTPNLMGLGNEVFTLLNNATAEAITGLSLSGYSSVAGTFEVQRKNNGSSFRMVAQFIASLLGDGSGWKFDLGAFQGDDLFSESLDQPQNTFIWIDESGQFFYSTGSMDAYQYEGEFKLSLTRINA